MDAMSHWHQLSAALDALLDLPPETRESRLAEIAASDPAQAATLRDLLAAEAREGPLDRGLGTRVREALDERAAAEAISAADIGEHIGAWKLLRPIGRGGMGELFLVEREGAGFSQRAALKRLKRGMDSEEILRRFLQERQILARLNHPNIARLLDGGIDASGRPYFVMEYVEGSNIVDFAREHSLDLVARLRLLQHVCEAVAYAQQHLVVHRDIKPGNVLVDADGEPHLLDFGIAKLLEDDDPDANRTAVGLRLLSPAYAAPEQRAGQAVGTATDVYALGLLLFELLCGQLPERRDPTDDDASTARQATAEPRPSQTIRRVDDSVLRQAWGQQVPLRERLARRVGGDLERIVLTALQIEPERRYPTAAALARDIGHFLAGQPIDARPDSRGYRLRRFLSRHRTGVGAAGFALLALLIGLGTALWQAREAREQTAEALRQRSSAELARQQAEAQAQRAEETRRFVVSLLQSANPEQAHGGAATSAVDLVRAAAERVERELGAVPLTQAELRVAVGSGLISLGADGDGRSRMDAGIAQLRSLGPEADPALASALHQAAMDSVAHGRIDEGEQLSNEALTIFQQLGDSRDFTLGRIGALTTLAKIAGVRGDNAGMQARFQRILDERERLLGPDDPRLAVDWNNLGASALRLDHYDAAEHAYAEAARVMARDPQAPESRFAWLRIGRAAALTGLGRHDEAEREALAARDIAERTLHADHPILASIHAVLATLYRYQQRLPEAEAAATRAVAINATLHAPDLAVTEMTLGLIQLAAGRPQEALTTLQTAEAHFATQRNREEPAYWQLRAALGLARLLANTPQDSQRVDALTEIDEALGALRQRQATRGNPWAETLGYRARAAEALHTDDAPQWRQQELDALRALLGPTHPRVREREAASHPPPP